MSIEQAIAANTAALEALTAALVATAKLAPTGGAAADKPAGTKPAGTKPATPKGPTREEMIAVLTKLKDDQGAEAAKAVVKEKGGVAKMADIPDGKIKAVYDEAKAKLEGGAEEPTEEEGDL